MAVFNRVQVGLKPTSHAVEVPNTPKAKLMYYLDSMCSVLKMDDDRNINRLRRFRQHFLLSKQDRDLLIRLCILLQPDMLLNKCIFQNDALCGDRDNKFFDLETVQNNFVVAGNVLIGGRNRKVTKIMAFTKRWLENNWSRPLDALLEEQRRERLAAMLQHPRTVACNIM